MKFWQKLKKYFNFKSVKTQEFDISKDFNFAGEDGDDDPSDDPDGPPPCPPPDPNQPPCPPCPPGGGGPNGTPMKHVFSAPGIDKATLQKGDFEEFKGFESKIVGSTPFPGGSNVNVCPVPPSCAPGGSFEVEGEIPDSQGCRYRIQGSGSGGNNPGGGIQCTFTY